MAINNHTTASSSPLARTDTPLPTTPQQAAQGLQPPRLHAVEPRTSSLTLFGTSTSPLNVTQPPQLQAGPTPNSPRSQLRAAARDGDGNVVKHVLATARPATAAADPATGMTALMCAAYGGHTATLEMLLKAGAKVDQANTYGMTALMWAAQNGHTATLQALLQAGADWKLKSRNDTSALSAAIANKHDEVIDLLHAHGATG